MAFRINGIKPIKALPGYEARVGFTGHSPPPTEALIPEAIDGACFDDAVNLQILS